MSNGSTTAWGLHPTRANYYEAMINLDYHPVLSLLQSKAAKIGYTFTSPFDFVDFCETVRGSSSADEKLAKRVQLLEWQLLFDWCWNKARSA